MSLRIIGGQFKGRILKTPKGSLTRPTQGMLRESVFNICQLQIEGGNFLDLFAGSGAMGLESISRGAAHATLVEKDRNALIAIRENIASLQIESQVSLMTCSAEVALQRLASPFDIIYIDPPYALPAAPLVEKVLGAKLLAPQGILFIEERFRAKATAPLFSSLLWIDSRKFGDALLHQYRSALAISSV